MFEALFSQLRGRFDFDAVKPVFIPFYVSLPISAYAAARPWRRGGSPSRRP